MHQKNVREQEQERQWKQLQALRAREQQIQQMQHGGHHDKMQGRFTAPNVIPFNQFGFTCSYSWRNIFSLHFIFIFFC